VLLQISGYDDIPIGITITETESAEIAERIARPVVGPENLSSSSGPVSTWMGDRLRAGIPFRHVTS